MSDWLTRLSAAVKGRLPGPYAFDTLRHCVNEENYPDQRGIKLNRETTDFLSLMGNCADELVALVEAADEFQRTHVHHPNTTPLFAALEALRRKVELA